MVWYANPSSWVRCQVLVRCGQKGRCVASFRLGRMIGRCRFHPRLDCVKLSSSSSRLGAIQSRSRTDLMDGGGRGANERYDSTACLRHDRTPSTRQTQSFAAGEGAAAGAVAEYKGKGILTAGVAADREMREGGVPKEPSVRYQVL